MSAMENVPVYIKAKTEGVLDERIEGLQSRLSPCILCPRECRADRMAGEIGYCKAPYELYISSAAPHFGEESPLVGVNGSGTIFLTHCNLKCIFCQNYDISIFGEGRQYSGRQMAQVMMELQRRGCHNINFVTPTHYVPQILKALSIAIDMGLSIPLVYNCGGYESLETLKLLDGIIDIYMPDIKFLDGSLSERFCNAGDYPRVAREAVLEMRRQVGDLYIDSEGIAKRGLLIRHLVMPSCGEDTKDILRFIRDEVSENAYVNIMAQYHPCCRADEHKEISRRINHREYLDALMFAGSLGLARASNH